MKYCSNCGKELTDEQKTCPNCGYTDNAETAASVLSENKRSWDVLSIVGFCISLVGLLIDLIVFIDMATDTNLATVLLLIVGLIVGGIFGAVGTLLSIIGLVLAVNKQKRGKAFAIIGIVVGALCACSILISIAQ